MKKGLKAAEEMLITMVVLLMLTTHIAIAQDKTAAEDVNLNGNDTDSGFLSGSPWIWIIFVIVLIVVIVTLTRDRRAP